MNFYKHKTIILQTINYTYNISINSHKSIICDRTSKDFERHGISSVPRSTSRTLKQTSRHNKLLFSKINKSHFKIDEAKCRRNLKNSILTNLEKFNFNEDY